MSTTTCGTCGPIEVRFCRSPNGRTVHREECTRRGSHSVEWHYAARELGNDLGRVHAKIAEIPWLKACGHCMAVAS